MHTFNSDERVCALFQRLNIPPSAIHDLRRKVADGDLLTLGSWNTCGTSSELVTTRTFSPVTPMVLCILEPALGQVTLSVPRSLAL